MSFKAISDKATLPNVPDIPFLLTLIVRMFCILHVFFSIVEVFLCFTAYAQQ